MLSSAARPNRAQCRAEITPANLPQLSSGFLKRYKISLLIGGLALSFDAYKFFVAKESR